MRIWNLRGNFDASINRERKRRIGHDRSESVDKKVQVKDGVRPCYTELPSGNLWDPGPEWRGEDDVNAV